MSWKVGVLIIARWDEEQVTQMRVEAQSEQTEEKKVLSPSTANLAGNILVDGCHHGLMAPPGIWLTMTELWIGWGPTRLVWPGNVFRIQTTKHGNTQVGKGRRKRWARKRSLDYCSIKPAC